MYIINNNNNINNHLNSYSSPDLVNGKFVLNHYQPLKKHTWLDYSAFHSLKHQLEPLFYIERNNLLEPILSKKQLRILQDLNITLTFTQDNRPFISATSNPEFIKTLEGLGFFNVFRTNSGKFGVQLSQVVMFLELGIEWVRNGFTMEGHLYNIHHLSQDVCDNRLSNLDVLPVDVHSFITSLQVGNENVPTNLYSKDYLLSVFTKVPLTTKDGRKVKGKTQWLSRLSQVIRTTLIKSAAFCLSRMKQVEASLDVEKCKSDNLVNLFGLVALYPSTLGLVQHVNSWMQGKSIPCINEIQSKVLGWYKEFKKYLGSKSNPTSLFPSYSAA